MRPATVPKLYANDSWSLSFTASQVVALYNIHNGDGASTQAIARSCVLVMYSSHDSQLSGDYLERLLSTGSRQEDAC